MDNHSRYRLCFLGIVLSVLLCFIVLQEEKRMQSAADRQLGAAIETGAVLYEQHCRKCHGSRGEGVGQLGPPLADQHFFSERKAEVGWLGDLAEYVAATTTQGRMMATRPLYAGNGRTAVMPPWLLAHGGPLRADEIGAISGFVMNWRPTALGQVTLQALVVPPTDLSDPATVRLGDSVFSNRCQACHRLDNGQTGGKTVGPDLGDIAGVAGTRIPRVTAIDYIRQSVLIPSAFVVDGYAGKAKDQECGAIISEEQLEAVTAFLLHRNQ